MIMRLFRGRTLSKIFIRFLARFARRFSVIYLMAVLVLALLGFGFLLLFPMLAIYAMVQLSASGFVPTADNPYEPMLWYGISIFGLVMSYHVLSLRFERPRGVQLKKTNSRVLHDWLRLNSDSFTPSISEIVITDKYSLRFVKIPLFGIPFWHRNFIVMGFPYMQSMSETSMKCALIRLLNQYSKRQNALTNWLHFLADVWYLYPDRLKRRALWGDLLLFTFFRYYAPLYMSVSRFIAQRDELKADDGALELVNDLDLLETIETEYLIKSYLNQAYWPVMQDLLLRKRVRASEMRPYSSLPSGLNKGLDKNQLRKYLLKSYAQDRSYNWVPSLRARMENMGHRRLKMPTMSQFNSAQYFFEGKYSRLAKHFDQNWLKQQHSLSNIGKMRPQHTGLRSNLGAIS